MVGSDVFFTERLSLFRGHGIVFGRFLYMYISIYIHPLGIFFKLETPPGILPNKHPLPESFIQILRSLTFQVRCHKMNEWLGLFYPRKKQGKHTPKGIHSDGRYCYQFKDLVSPVKKGKLYSPSGWIRFGIKCSVFFLFAFFFLSFQWARSCCFWRIWGFAVEKIDLRTFSTKRWGHMRNFLFFKGFAGQKIPIVWPRKTRCNHGLMKSSVTVAPCLSRYSKI